MNQVRSGERVGARLYGSFWFLFSMIIKIVQNVKLLQTKPFWTYIS